MMKEKANGKCVFYLLSTGEMERKRKCVKLSVTQKNKEVKVVEKYDALGFHSLASYSS